MRGSPVVPHPPPPPSRAAAEVISLLCYLCSLRACLDVGSMFFLLPFSVACFQLTRGGETPAAVFWQQLATWAQPSGGRNVITFFPFLVFQRVIIWPWITVVGDPL